MKFTPNKVHASIQYSDTKVKDIKFYKLQNVTKQKNSKYTNKAVYSHLEREIQKEACYFIFMDA